MVSRKCKVTKIYNERNTNKTQITIDCDKGYVVATVRPCEIVDYRARPVKQSVGTKAYPLIEKYLKKKGCRNIQLIRVTPESRGFWMRMGYESDGWLKELK